MTYNYFTISYITAVQECLDLYPDSTGTISVNPDGITDRQLTDLKLRLENLWADASSAVELLARKEEAYIQSCLFGLVNDFELALKTGFLLGDRVVITDYLYERILCKKKPQSIDRTSLSVIVWGLVSCLELAKAGRVVIIPHPLSWNETTRELFSEVAEDGLLSPSIMSLLSVLSIAKRCKLQPYTIAESDQEYQEIVGHQLDLTDYIGNDKGITSYKAILGALMTEKLINENRINLILNVPLTRYAAIVAEKKAFYLAFLNRLTQANSDHSQEIVDDLSKNLQKDIIDSDIVLTKFINDQFGTSAGLVSTGISVAVAISTLSPTFKAVGAGLGLLAKVSGLFKNSASEDKNIIAVFKKLYQES